MNEQDQVDLRWFPKFNKSLHLTPSQGKPECVLAWVTQNFIKVIADLRIYTAIVATLTLLIVIFGVPFVGGR